MALALPRLVQVPSPNWSSRRGAVIDTIVVHDCQGSGRGAAGYFATRASGVSAQFVCDEVDTDLVYQCVACGNKAWHACNANPYAIGVEMGGYAERGFPDAELDRAAWIVAWLMRAYGITNQFVTGRERNGWTTHFRLGAFGGGHTDFTTDPAAEARFGRRVTDAYDALGQGPLPDWGLHGVPGPRQVELPPAAPAGFAGRPRELSDESGPTLHLTPSGYPAHTMGDLQWKLRRVGANPQLKVDTFDGPATEAAILTFKKAVGLPATPGLGAEFWAKLDRAAAA
jgi:hypothetical protein